MRGGGIFNGASLSRALGDFGPPVGLVCKDPNAVSTGLGYKCICREGYHCSEAEDSTFGCQGNCIAQLQDINVPEQQKALCIGTGGTWTGSECVFPGQAPSKATPELCTSVGMDYDATIGQCVATALAKKIDECIRSGGLWNDVVGACAAAPLQQGQGPNSPVARAQAGGGLPSWFLPVAIGGLALAAVAAWSKGKKG